MAVIYVGLLTHEGDRHCMITCPGAAGAVPKSPWLARCCGGAVSFMREDQATGPSGRQRLGWLNAA